MPEEHRTFLETIVRQLREDARMVGIAVGGSFVTGSMDEFSDLDMVIAVEPREYAEVMREREDIAGSLGNLLAAFTGEHVGEPRLLVCLYDPPLLRVDLKFVALSDLRQRIEDPVVLWERDGRLTAVLQQAEAKCPSPDPQWIEERFWVWMQYGAAKIGRGELFKALELLSFLRVRVLGPLALHRAGWPPSGVRKIEIVTPEFADELRRTVASYDAPDCFRALRACADIYRSLRGTAGGVELREASEEAAMAYMAAIERRVA